MACLWQCLAARREREKQSQVIIITITMVIRRFVTIIMGREKLTLDIRRAREKLTPDTIIMAIIKDMSVIMVIMARERQNQDIIITMAIRKDMFAMVEGQDSYRVQ